MPKSVLTLGTFDGIHRGHQALFKKVIARARSIRAKSVALAFDMPPRHTGDPLTKPVLLTTLREKLAAMKQLGINQVHVLVFDRKTKTTPPEQFFRKVIQKKHDAREMVVGPKVAFGKDRAGRLPLLRRLGRTTGIKIHVVSEIGKGKTQVSSRRIRAFLTGGHVEKANALLGYPYSVEGTVVHGARRGRRLGFPTANIEADPQKILPRGVFWVKVLPPGKFPLTAQDAAKGVDGVCNVGIRPTFHPHAHALHCEVFLLNPKSTSLYGKQLRVIFLRRLRPERRFQSSLALQRQIAKDVARACQLSAKRT